VFIFRKRTCTCIFMVFLSCIFVSCMVYGRMCSYQTQPAIDQPAYMDAWKKYHKAACTSLPEDEHLDVRNMSKTLQLNSNLNHLTPNGHFSGRTAPLTSRLCILYIYSTNIRTEYFKHAAHSSFFSSSNCRLFHNATFFGSCIIHILYTGCAKI
jgi:hypothetical protein